MPDMVVLVGLGMHGFGKALTREHLLGLRV